MEDFIEHLTKSLNLKSEALKLLCREKNRLSTEGFKVPVSVVMLKVHSIRQIVELLKLTNKECNSSFKFSVYPIATGKNWGYGSALPSTSSGNVVLLDLGGLNQIIDFDKENGLVTLQPGVTQQQLYDYLKRQSDPFIKLGQVVTKKLNFSILNSVSEQLEKLSAGMEVMQGKPSQVALPLAYWRNPRVRPDKSRPMDPAKDGCGLLWYAPLVPAKAKPMKAFIEMIRRIAPKYNIEPMITFTCLSGISTDSTIPIVFDLENPQAIEDAHACLKALFEEGLKQGFIPYRLNIKQQLELNANSTFWKTAGKIAHALDPNGIISPDRYNPYKP